MAVSPICLVKDGAGPFVATTNGVNVTAGNVISIKLNNITDVVDWYLQVTGTDETSSNPTLAGVNIITNLVATPGTVVTFTMPSGAGRAFLFRSIVTGTGGPIETTFTIYVVTAHGFRVGATGEEREGNATFGWATILNPLIRTGAGVIRYNDSLASPTTGFSTVQQFLDFLKGTTGAGGDLIIFSPGNPHVGNVFGDWAEMCAYISTLPPGSKPRVRFTGSFTIPSAGMPPSGWFMNLGSWESFTSATGAVIVDIPDGVKIDMLEEIDFGMEVNCYPSTEYGVFNWSLFPPGTVPWILLVGRGGKLDNLGTKAAIITPGAVTQTYVVFAVDASTTNIPPSSTAPIIKSSNNDVIIASQILCGPFGGISDGWVVGTGSALVYQNGVDALHPFITPGPFVAQYPGGWTGPAPTILQESAARNVNYNDLLAPPITGATTVQEIIDILKAGGGGGAPSGPAGGSLTGTYPNPQVRQIDGSAGVAPVAADLLRWINTAVAGLAQDAPPNGATPTTSFTLTTQPPNAGGGLVTGKPGDFNLVIPVPVGGAPNGVVTVAIGLSTPLQLTTDGAIAPTYQVGVGGPKILGVPALPGVGTVPEGTLALMTNPLDPSPAYIAHNSVWVGVGGAGTLAGDTEGPGTANVLTSIRDVPTPKATTEFPGANIKVDNVPPWDFPWVVAWDTVDNILWIGDRTNFTLYRYNPSQAASKNNPKAYNFTSPQVQGIYSMVMDTTYLYVVGNMSAPGPGTPNVFIIDRATRLIVGTASTANPLSAFGIEIDNAGNFFVLQPGFDIEKYNTASVVGAYPANGTPVATVPGTSTLLSKGDMCFDGTYLYATTDLGGGFVFKIDPVAATVLLATVPGVTGEGLAAGGGYVWLASNGVSQIDPATMAVLTTVPIPGPTSGGIVYDPVNNNVWITESFGSSLWVIDAIVLGPATPATGIYVGDSPGGPKSLCFQSTANPFGINNRIWKTTPVTGFPGAPGFQGIRRYNPTFFGEEVRFVGPLSLKYFVPAALNTVHQISAGDSPWTVTFSDDVPVPTYVLLVDTTFPVPGPVTVNLPPFPSTGDTVLVKDATGQCNLNNITIVPSFTTIDGGASYVLTASYQSATLIYSGSYWSVV